MFEGADRHLVALMPQPSRVSIEAQYICTHCGLDKRKGPFSFMARKLIVGCCRASVAERAGVLPDQVNVCQSFLSD